MVPLLGLAVTLTLATVAETARAQRAPTALVPGRVYTVVVTAYPEDPALNYVKGNTASHSVTHTK